MIPVLFPAEATDWSTNGLGRLAEAISCTVTEERNGQYELEMTYPISGARYKDLKNDAIIYAKAFEGAETDHPFQPFRIYKISKPLNGQVTVNASHISYALSYCPVGIFETGDYTANQAMDQIKKAIKDPTNKFTLLTDMTNGRNKGYESGFGIDTPISVRSAIGGDDGFIDTYGGEVLWDNFNVKLLSSRGRDNGVQVRYGKNLTDLKEETNIQNTYTAIYAYYKKDSDDDDKKKRKVVESDIIKCANASKFAFTRTYIYDASSDFDNTVISAYRINQSFYKDSDGKEGVTPTKDNYYDDQNTVQNVYFDGNFLYKDKPSKKMVYGYYRKGKNADSEMAFYKRQTPPGNKSSESDEAYSGDTNTYYVDLNGSSNTGRVKCPNNDVDQWREQNFYTANGHRYHNYKCNVCGQIVSVSDQNAGYEDAIPHRNWDMTHYYATAGAGTGNVYIYKSDNGKSWYERYTNGQFIGNRYYSNIDLSKRIKLDPYNYYSDNETVVSGHYHDGKMYEDTDHTTEIIPKIGHYYQSNSNDIDDITTTYYYDGSKYVKQVDQYGNLIDKDQFSGYKAIYKRGSDDYTPVYSSTTNNISTDYPDYIWKYNGSTYEVISGDIPTKEDLNRLATKYMNENDFGVPDVELTISYQPLWQTEEYKNIAPVERVKLCDTVTVIFEKLGVHTTAKVTKTVYNTLLDRYDSVELDSNWNKDNTRDLSGTIANQSNTIKQSTIKQNRDMQAAISRATQMISGGLGGYVRLHYSDDNGYPDELLIMDESDYTKAKNVMRFNKNGIGFSQTGYQGPFTSAWTIDGAFNASWITTGLLTAITMQTASEGLRLMIEGASSAIKGMSGDKVVNILDMINGSGPDADMLIDAKEGLTIRTPRIGVINKSYGEDPAEVYQCLTSDNIEGDGDSGTGFQIVTNVSKDMDIGGGSDNEKQKTREIGLKGVSEDECDVWVTLPVRLKVEGKKVRIINGLMTTQDKYWSKSIMS